jgi:hypothetical protein
VMLILHTVLSWQLAPAWGATAAAVSVTIAELVLLSGCLIVLQMGRPGRLLTDHSVLREAEREAITLP